MYKRQPSYWHHRSRLACNPAWAEAPIFGQKVLAEPGSKWVKSVNFRGGLETIQNDSGHRQERSEQVRSSFRAFPAQIDQNVNFPSIFGNPLLAPLNTCHRFCGFGMLLMHSIGAPNVECWAPRVEGGLQTAPRGLQTAGSLAQDVGDLLRNFGKIAPKF